jgi:3-hydroxybutyryl-CoA dehydratase
MQYHIGQSDQLSKNITEQDVLLMADLTHDYNSLHLDEEFSKSHRFKKKIVHGLFPLGLISAVLGTKLPGNGTIYIKQDIHFLKPVFIGDTITARVEIINIHDKNITLKTECFNHASDIVCSGIAIVTI